MNTSIFRIIIATILFASASPSYAAESAASNSSHGQSQIPQPKIHNKEKIQDWEVVCGEIPVAQQKTENLCTMTQTVVEKENKEPVLKVEIVKKQNRHRAFFVAPLGIGLTPGFTLEVPGTKAIQFPIDFCLPAGCSGTIELNNTLLNSLKKQNQATFIMATRFGHKLEMPISLKGFSASLKKLR